MVEKLSELWLSTSATTYVNASIGTVADASIDTTVDASIGTIVDASIDTTVDASIDTIVNASIGTTISVDMVNELINDYIITMDVCTVYSNNVYSAILFLLTTYQEPPADLPPAEPPP